MIICFTPRLEVYSESSDTGTVKLQTAINDSTNTDIYRNSLRDPRLFAQAVDSRGILLLFSSYTKTEGNIILASAAYNKLFLRDSFEWI